MGDRGGRCLSVFISLLSLMFLNLSAPGASGAVEGAAPAKGGTITVTSDRMEALRKDGVIVFKGNVAAEEDFLLCSDELYLHYGKDKDIKEIEAVGRVRIFREDGLASSDRALYKRASRTLVLTGNAQIDRCGDTVKGGRITLHLDTDRAYVEGSTGGRVRAVIMPGKKCEGAGGPDNKQGVNNTNTPEKAMGGNKALCKRTR